MSDYCAYIDEAGDLGIGKGTRWFVISAVVVKKTDENAIRAKMAEIKSKLNIQEIHVRKVNDFMKRAYLVRELADQPFTYMNIIVDTDKFDKQLIPDPLIAYNFVCKYLLQRVSDYVKSIGASTDIVLSARGTSRDGELIVYIQDKLLPYPDNNIDKNTIGTVSAKAASAWELLQLADVCATTTFLAYEENGYGFCVPCYMNVLDSHLFRKNGRLDTYGIKFFVNDMKPQSGELMQKAICAKKKESPVRLPRDKHAGKNTLA